MEVGFHEDIDAAEQWLDPRVTRVNAQHSVELSRRVAALSGSAQGRDGSIRVTVAPSAQVERLDLDDRVHVLSGDRLLQEIMSTIRQAGLSGGVADEVRATDGEDGETGRAVIHSFDTRFSTPRDEEDR
jgi:hypothetical protein